MDTTFANKTFYLTTHILYLFLFASLIFSLRALSSMSIAAILLTGMIANQFASAGVHKINYKIYFLVGCTLLFLLQVISLLYTKDINEGWNSVRIKTGLVITPLAIYLSRCLDSTLLKKLLMQYCLMLTVASLFCLGVAFFRYNESGNVSVFFYHSLVSPISQHAIYFSLLALIGLIFLLETIGRNNRFFTRSFQLGLLIYLSIFLLLLSSKLVISFYLVYLLSIFIVMLKKNKVPGLSGAGLFLL